MANRNQSRCNGCGAIILWGRTPAGRPIPMDPTPITMPEGHYVILEEPGQPTRCIPAPKEVFQSHFVSCPDRDKFSRKKREVVHA